MRLELHPERVWLSSGSFTDLQMSMSLTVKHVHFCPKVFQLRTCSHLFCNMDPVMVDGSVCFHLIVIVFLAISKITLKMYFFSEFCFFMEASEQLGCGQINCLEIGPECKVFLIRSKFVLFRVKMPPDIYEAQVCHICKQSSSPFK